MKAAEERGCDTEAVETTETSNELSKKEGCYESNPSPAGCINMLIVDPAAALEVSYGGTLRAKAINGVGNGLDQTKFEFEGTKSGELQCEHPVCAPRRRPPSARSKTRATKPPSWSTTSRQSPDDAARGQAKSWPHVAPGAEACAWTYGRSPDRRDSRAVDPRPDRALLRPTFRAVADRACYQAVASCLQVVKINGLRFLRSQGTLVEHLASWEETLQRGLDNKCSGASRCAPWSLRYP